MKISVVINCDTRSGFQYDWTKAETMFNGCVSSDFLIDGVLNKMDFFNGFEIEVIVHVDKHNNIPSDVLASLNNICDTLIVRKHTDEISFNDYNYLRALQCASGDYVCHVDQDTACFANSPMYVQEMIDLLEHHSFVSYPSYWSPRAVTDETFGKRTWASTRFFICKREALKFDELYNCIKEPEWGYAKYGDSQRRCNWLEHFLTLTNNDSCFYPPIELEKLLVFSWGSYRKGTLAKLNAMSYDEILYYVARCGGVHYPNDLDAIDL